LRNSILIISDYGYKKRWHVRESLESSLEWERN
jgi:hypothetical protein